MKKIITLTVVLVFSLNQATFAKTQSKQMAHYAHNLLMQRINNTDSVLNAPVEEINKAMDDLLERVESTSEGQLKQIFQENLSDYQNMELPVTTKNLSAQEKEYLMSAVDPELMAATDDENHALELALKAEIQKQIASKVEVLKHTSKSDITEFVKESRETLKSKDIHKGILVPMIICMIIYLFAMGMIVWMKFLGGFLASIALAYFSYIAVKYGIAMFVLLFLVDTKKAVTPSTDIAVSKPIPIKPVTGILKSGVPPIKPNSAVVKDVKPRMFLD